MLVTWCPSHPMSLATDHHRLMAWSQAPGGLSLTPGQASEAVLRMRSGSDGQAHTAPRLCHWHSPPIVSHFYPDIRCTLNCHWINPLVLTTLPGWAPGQTSVRPRHQELGAAWWSVFDAVKLWAAQMMIMWVLVLSLRNISLHKGNEEFSGEIKFWNSYSVCLHP